MKNRMITMPRIVIGVIASMLVAGFGHFILGFWRRGIAWFTLGIVLGIVLSYFIPEVVLQRRISLFGTLFGIIAALDAWRNAELYNITVREREENPPVEM